jgi:hypothetical protein
MLSVGFGNAHQPTAHVCNMATGAECVTETSCCARRSSDTRNQQDSRRPLQSIPVLPCDATVFKHMLSILHVFDSRSA